MKQILKDDLLRHTVLLFSGMMVVHVSNLAFQMLVSRRLPEVEYALLAAFLAAIGIISFPLNTLTTGLGHYVSLLRRDKRDADIKRLTKKWLMLTGLPALGIGGLMILFCAPIAAFLHLDRTAPVIIAGAVMPALFWFPVLTGTAQGLELFGLNTSSAISGAFTKFLLGAGLVWFWHPACGWAMMGHSAGFYVSVFVLLLGLGQKLRLDGNTDEKLPSMRLYLGQSLFVQIAFAILMNADVILVKHLLPGDTEFPYAATLGRIVAFMPMAIAFAMFPKVASTGGVADEHRRIFLRSFLYTAICVVGAAAACMIVPGLVLRVLFGIRDASDHLIYLSRLMTLAMSACALLHVTVQFLLAQRRFRGLIITMISCVLYIVAAWMFDENSEQIAIAAIGFNLLALVSALLAALVAKPGYSTTNSLR